ncbi:MAG: DUF4199 domain-containing protein [Cytophagales bacterium]|nr:MAG: DUF4199 domain-containing protein [Cytophagales bacterium]TAF61270.1 MAG: DUF4199 domain-containing protein [Cytophagales bacterium]
MKILNSSLPYALLGGVLCFAWLILEYLLGLHSSNRSWYQYIASLDMCIFMFISFRALAKFYKASTNYTFWKGFGYGTLTIFFTSILGFLAQFIFYTYVNPDFFASLSEQYISEGMSQEHAARYFDPIGFMMRDCMSLFVIGLFISAAWAEVIKSAAKSSR